jgi:hypothetical protein
MANQPIYLNGVQFKPSNIDVSEDKIGVNSRAASGRLKFHLVTTKSQWKISWAMVDTATMNAVRTIYRLTSSFVFIDEQGVSHTVACLPGGFTSTLAATSISINNVVHYDVEITLDEV